MSYMGDLNLVPRACPLKNGWGAPPIFLRGNPWGRGWGDLSTRLVAHGTPISEMGNTIDDDASDLRE